jgi:hypothetical protein
MERLVSARIIKTCSLHHFYDHCMNDVPLLCENDEFRSWPDKYTAPMQNENAACTFACGVREQARVCSTFLCSNLWPGLVFDVCGAACRRTHANDMRFAVKSNNFSAINFVESY